MNHYWLVFAKRPHLGLRDRLIAVYDRYPEGIADSVDVVEVKDINEPCAWCNYPDEPETP